MTYSDIPYMDDENVGWVWKGKRFEFEKGEDLIGKEGVAALGESYGEAFDKFIHERLDSYRVAENKEVFQLLRFGRADYYPFSLYDGFEDALEYLPMPFTREGTDMAVSRKSKFLN